MSESFQQGKGAVRTSQIQLPFVLTIRQELDHYLWQKACDTVTFSINPPLKAVAQDGSTMLMEWSDGTTLSSRAIIAADGANSTLRQLLSPNTPSTDFFALEAIVSSVPLQNDKLHFFLSRDFHGYGWAFPKHDHWNIGLYTTRLSETSLGKEALQRFSKSCLHLDETPQGIRGAPVGCQVLNSACLENCILAGDAMGTTSPKYGDGIVRAIDSGIAAADSILQHFHTGAPIRAIHEIRFAAMRARLRREARECAAFYDALEGSGWPMH